MAIGKDLVDIIKLDCKRYELEWYLEQSKFDFNEFKVHLLEYVIGLALFPKLVASHLDNFEDDKFQKLNRLCLEYLRGRHEIPNSTIKEYILSGNISNLKSSNPEQYCIQKGL